MDAPQIDFSEYGNTKFDGLSNYIITYGLNVKSPVSLVKDTITKIGLHKATVRINLRPTVATLVSEDEDFSSAYLIYPDKESSYDIVRMDAIYVKPLGEEGDLYFLLEVI